MIRVVYPGSGSWLFTHPGSRIKVSNRHQIPNPDPQHWFLACQVGHKNKDQRQSMFGPTKKFKLTCSAFPYSRRTPRLSRGFLTGKCSRTSSRLRLEKNCVRHGRRWPAAGRRAKAHQLSARGVETRPFRLPPAVYHWTEQRNVRIEDFYSYFKIYFKYYQSTVPVPPQKYFLINKNSVYRWTNREKFGWKIFTRTSRRLSNIRVPVPLVQY
jgi:hypothetical protein